MIVQLAQHIAELQRPSRRQRHSHDVPLARNGMAECMESSLLIEVDLIHVGKDNSARANRHPRQSGSDYAVAHCSGGVVAASSHDRDARPDPQLRCSRGVHLPAHYRRLVAVRHPIPRYLEVIEHLLRPCPVLHIEQKCP